MYLWDQDICPVKRLLLRSSLKSSSLGSYFLQYPKYYLQTHWWHSSSYSALKVYSVYSGTSLKYHLVRKCNLILFLQNFMVHVLFSWLLHCTRQLPWQLIVKDTLRGHFLQKSLHILIIWYFMQQVSQEVHWNSDRWIWQQ